MKIRKGFNKGMGWKRDYPSFKDYTIDTDDENTFQLSDRVDLRHYCSPVDNQGTTQSCTAHAAANLIEYWQNKTQGKYINVSKLFIYKVARKLAGIEGDMGGYLRTTAQALVLFGVPPEEYFPFDETKVEEEPGPFVYAIAQNYQSLVYYRLDKPFMSGKKLLQQIKLQLSKEIPCMFGFSVWDSIQKTDSTGLIPFPEKNNFFCGGHAIIAVGYDNEKGALLIKNSWGDTWGNKGFGWLPYEYVIHDLTADWWCITKNEWVDMTQFALNTTFSKGEVVV